MFSESFVVEHTLDQITTSEAWCRENLGPRAGDVRIGEYWAWSRRWEVPGVYRYQFASEDLATLFLLRWGQ